MEEFLNKRVVSGWEERPEFKTWHAHKRSGVVGHICNSSIGVKWKQKYLKVWLVSSLAELVRPCLKMR